MYIISILITIYYDTCILFKTGSNKLLYMINKYTRPICLISHIFPINIALNKSNILLVFGAGIGDKIDCFCW